MTPKPFLHAAFLRELEQFTAGGVRPVAWSPTLAGILLGGNDDTRPSPTAVHLIALLHARQAVLKAAFDTARVADELRRYQKFAKPGRPSPHIVQLRQQQAAARQASSQSRQLLIQSAAALSGTRTLNRTTALSATTFSAPPPEILATLTVTPSC